MPMFPFFQYPYNINRPYPRSPFYNQKKDIDKLSIPSNYEEVNKDDRNFKNTQNRENLDKQNKSSRYSGFGPIHFQNPFSINSDEPILEILGISLYLDDLIILGLLFFLYQEEVKDDMLFLILILLLLS